MCDPFTLTSVASGISTLGGTTLLQGTALGTGLTNVAGAITSSGLTAGATGGFFSMGNAMGAIRNISTIANSPFASVGLSLMSYNAERTRAGYEIAQARYQQQQYKEELEKQRLEQMMRENERKRRYISEFSSNQAIAAASGVDIASASYQALFKSNRETYLRDRDAIRMSSLDEIIQSRKNLELAKMKEGQATKLSKTTPAIALGRGLLKTKQLFDEQ